MIKLYLFPVLLLSLTSCTMQPYQAPSGDNLATISFSNISTSPPTVSIGESCHFKKIDFDWIEKKAPSNRGVHRLNVLADKEIDINVKFYDVAKGDSKLVLKGNAFVNHMELVETKNFIECSRTISFKPEVNKHYEISIGGGMRICFIKVAEAESVIGAMDYNLLQVATAKSNQC